MQAMVFKNCAAYITRSATRASASLLQFFVNSEDGPYDDARQGGGTTTMARQACPSRRRTLSGTAGR